MLSTANEPFQRVAVRFELEPQLRRYRRLLISCDDLQEAKATILKILESDLRFPRGKEPDPLLTALTTALVVSYARPFVNSRGHSRVAERTVPGSLLRVLPSRERDLHDALIEMRTREIAHSDAEVLELSIMLFPGGDGSISRLPRQPLRRVELRMLNRMIDKLTDEIDHLCMGLREQLPLGVWL